MNYKYEAEKILQEHTEAVMRCTSDMSFDCEDEMFDLVMRECAFILTQKLIEGEYTPLQYNEVRNALAALLNKIFKQ